LSPHRRIAASPHRRIAASPHRRIAESGAGRCLWASSRDTVRLAREETDMGRRATPSFDDLSAQGLRTKKPVVLRC